MSLRLLWLARLSFEISHGIFQFAILWFVYSFSHSLIFTGVAFAIILLPLALSRLFTGVIVDRYDKKVLMCISIAAIMVLLYPIWYFFNIELITIVLPIILLYAFFAQLYVLANNASIRLLISKEHVSKAVSIIQFSVRLGTLVGFIVGGLLASILHDLIFIALVTPCVVSLVFSIMVRIENPHKQNVDQSFIKSYFQDLKQGFLYLCKHKTLIMILAIVTVLLFLEMPFIIVGLKYISLLGGNEVFYGLYIACIEAGALIGAVLSSKLNIREKAGLILCTAMLLSSLPRIGLGVNKILLCSIFLAFLLGVALSIINIALTSVVWGLTEKEIIGRVLGVLSTVTQITQPIATIVAGILGTLVEPHELFIIIGISSAIIGAMLLLSKQIRELKY